MQGHNQAKNRSQTCSPTTFGDSRAAHHLVNILREKDRKTGMKVRSFLQHYFNITSLIPLGNRGAFNLIILVRNDIEKNLRELSLNCDNPTDIKNHIKNVLWADTRNKIKLNEMFLRSRKKMLEAKNKAI